MDLNAQEQSRLEVVMQKKQQKEFMKMFFNVTADCFTTCVNDFSSKSLSPREVSLLQSTAFSFCSMFSASLASAVR